MIISKALSDIQLGEAVRRAAEAEEAARQAAPAAPAAPAVEAPAAPVEAEAAAARQAAAEAAVVTAAVVTVAQPSELRVAVKKGDLAEVTRLADRGADVEDADGSGATALIWAAAKGHRPVVEFLLKRGARLDTVNKNGRTPLHFAAHYGHTDICGSLLKSNADINPRDNDGHTPLEWAISKGKTATAEFLRGKGGVEKVEAAEAPAAAAEAAEEAAAGLIFVQRRVTFSEENEIKEFKVEDVDDEKLMELEQGSKCDKQLIKLIKDKRNDYVEKYSEKADNYYSIKTIEDNEYDLFVFGANDKHMINRSIGGDGQADATYGKSNVVPIVNTNFSGINVDDIVNFNIEVGGIVEEFYLTGGTIIFPVIKIENPGGQSSEEVVNIGTGIASITSLGEWSQKFANHLFNYLCNKPEKNFRKGLTPEQRMENYNRSMNDLQEKYTNREAVATGGGEAEAEARRAAAIEAEAAERLQEEAAEAAERLQEEAAERLQEEAAAAAAAIEAAERLQEAAAAAAAGVKVTGGGAKPAKLLQEEKDRLLAEEIQKEERLLEEARRAAAGIAAVPSIRGGGAAPGETVGAGEESFFLESSNFPAEKCYYVRQYDIPNVKKRYPVVIDGIQLIDSQNADRCGGHSLNNLFQREIIGVDLCPRPGKELFSPKQEEVNKIGRLRERLRIIRGKKRRLEEVDEQGNSKFEDLRTSEEKEEEKEEEITAQTEIDEYKQKNFYDIDIEYLVRFLSGKLLVQFPGYMIYGLGELTPSRLVLPGIVNYVQLSMRDIEYDKIKNNLNKIFGLIENYQGHYVCWKWRQIGEDFFWYRIDSRALDVNKVRIDYTGVICKYTETDFSNKINEDIGRSEEYSLESQPPSYLLISTEHLGIESTVLFAPSPLKLKNPKSKYLSPTSKIKKERKKKKDKINKLKKNHKK